MPLMAENGKVVISGRYPPGALVALWQVDSEGTLRHEGGELIDARKVGNDGVLTFKRDVEIDGRYIAYGYVDGMPLSVRLRGLNEDEVNTVLSQPPQAYVVTKLADGTVVGADRKVEDAPELEAAPHLGMQHVSDDTPLRSFTQVGEAHPVDAPEPAPHTRQEDTDGELQASDTQTGRRAPVSQALAQEDVPDGALQRSSTETGSAALLPRGGAVAAQRDKESVAAKEARGEPVQAAARPAEKQTPGDGSPVDEPAHGDDLKGQALEDRVHELGLTGLSGASADEKRAAVAEAEKSR